MDKLRLLIIENKSSLRKAYADIVENNHSKTVFEISPAQNAAEAKTLLKNTFYHIVIIGSVPDSNSPSMCKWIRQLADGNFSFVIIITPDKTKDTINELLDAGCDDFLESSEDMDEFRLRINVALFSVEHRIKRKEAENNLKDSQEHMEAVLNSLNLGTVLLDNKDKILYFNEPMQKLCDNALQTGLNFMECVPVDVEGRTKLSSWLSLPRNKTVVKTAKNWFELEYFSSSADKILYAVDITELMLLKINSYGKQALIGESPAFIRMKQQIPLLSRGDWNILITGETGTGKELVAEELHARSKRYKKTFLTVNCAGLPESLASSALFGHKKGAFTGAVNDQEGFFEAARGGTLFLDEIGDISSTLQVMLLRAIEQKEIIRVGETTPRKVDVRIIAATNKNLYTQSTEGSFRLDLYYRLNEAELFIPPLRERKEDIPLLLDYFIKQNNLRYPELSDKISNDCLKFLINYDWPGNIRELKSAIQFAAIQAAGKTITVNNLPKLMLEQENASNRIDEQQLKSAIKKAGGNISRAASILGVSRTSVYRLIKKYSIN